MVKRMDEKNSQAELAKRWNAMINAAVDGIVVIDKTGRITSFNQAAERMFEYQERDLINKNVNILIPAPYKDQHDHFIQGYLQTKNASIIGKGRQTQGLKSDGTMFPIYLSVGEVLDDEEPQFVGIIRDISEQEKYRVESEKIREKLAHISRINAIGEMVAEVAHEIKQPITAIDSYAKASVNIAKSALAKAELANDSMTDDIQKIVNIQAKIESQVFRATSLSEKLRHFARKTDGHSERLKIDDLISETIDLAKLDSRFSAHQIKLSLESFPCAYVYVDALQIQQVLLNLIRNGFEAMLEKAGCLLVSCARENASQIKISVRDEGLGLADDIKNTMFDPFVSTKEDGMGMGLAVSQTIVHAHGGDISFSSNDDGGTTFSFVLPTIDSEA